MKGTVILLVAIFLLSASGLALARDVSIDLRPIQQNINVGDELSVKVNIDQVSDLKGVDVIISFDNLKLDYKSITKEALISSFEEDIVTDPEESATTGKIEYSAVIPLPGPGVDSPGGNIFTVNFVARAPGEAWVKLDDTNDVPLGNSMANAIPTIIDTDRHIINIGQVFRLKQVFNYPNPAPNNEGNTIIRVEALALLDELEARIYDVSGEPVKTIDNNDFNTADAPVYEYIWNCKNEEDQDVANGTYILWLKAKLGSDEKHETWKIAVLR